MAEEEGQQVTFTEKPATSTEKTAANREIYDEKGGLLKKGAAETGITLSQNSGHRMSLKEIEATIADRKQAGDEKGVVEASIDLARFYLRNGDAQEALKISKEARITARRLNEAKLESDTIQVISSILAVNGDFEEATREAYDAVNVAKKVGDAEAIATATLHAVALHYQSVAKENPGSDIFKEGLKELLGTAEDATKAFRKLKNTAGHASALVALARVYMLADEPDKAKFSADMAYMLYNQAKDGNGFVDACICLSHAHIQRSDWASAMRYCNEADELCRQFQDMNGLSVVGELRDQIRECSKLASEQRSNTVYNAMMMQKLSFR